ncbi:MAG TPA: hypothetical protein VGI64_05985 [Streptosporangiaceae bacterium]
MTDQPTTLADTLSPAVLAALTDLRAQLPDPDAPPAAVFLPPPGDPDGPVAPHSQTPWPRTTRKERS